MSLLAKATKDLAIHSDSAKLDAEILLAKAIQKPRSYFYTWPEEKLQADCIKQFDYLIKRRIAGEPIAYITGQQAFWSLDLTVTRNTLIPRPETELLVEIILEKIPTHKACRIIDLGTGSGAIALALAKERPRCHIIATDKTNLALEIAKKNAHDLGIKNVVFNIGDWLLPFKNQYFDFIVTNPPYIRNNDPHLEQGDLRYEPRDALQSGIDGLDDIEKIISQAKNHLKPAGWLLLEHGYNQAEEIVKRLNSNNYCNIKPHKDYAQLPRVIEAQASFASC